MICYRCRYEFQAENRERLCPGCVSGNSQRARKARLTPKELARGTRWRYKRVPEINGIVETIFDGGYVRLEIHDNNGEFSWTSTIADFLVAWEKIKPESKLDLEVEEFAKSTRRIPLPSQMCMLDES